MPTPRLASLQFPLLLALAGALLAPSVDAPRLAVEQGAVLRKVFVMTWNMDLEELSFTVDGESIEADDELTIEQDERQRLEFVDSYRAVKDGRALELVRRFEKLESESTTDTNSQEGKELTEQTRTSALEGREVLFLWDGEAEAYAAEFVEEGADGELLEDLEQDADLAGFLPSGEVEVEASWTVGIDAVRKLLSPGGDLTLVDEDGEEEDDAELSEQFEENLSGELTATYRGKREVDGREVALIELQGELETEAELEDEGGALGSATMTMTLEGELVWDLGDGHFQSIRLSGPCEIEFSSSAQEAQHEFEQSLMFKGTFEYQGDVTREG